MEFFVKERIAERYAEADKHCLGQDLPKQRASILKLKLGQITHWLGVQLINWSKMLQHVDKTSTVDQHEHLPL